MPPNLRIGEILGWLTHPLRTRTKFDSRAFLANGPKPGGLEVSAAHYFPEIEFRPVQTVEEFEEVAALVQTEYQNAGFVSKNHTGKRLSIHQILPTTVAFIARHNTLGLLATLSFIEDSRLGLPMESIYSKEVKRLRQEGRPMGEISMFAADKLKMKKIPLSERFILLCHLIRRLVDYARAERKIEILLECCHPKHDNLYKTLGAELFGELKEYSSVNNNPAISRFWDIPKGLAEGRTNTACRLFYLDLPDKRLFAKRLRLSKKDIERLFLTESGLLCSASVRERWTIAREYPEYDLIDLLVDSKEMLDDAVFEDIMNMKKGAWLLTY